MLDSGATGIAFMSREFAARQKYSLRPLDQPLDVESADGTPLGSGKIDSQVSTTITLNGHEESLDCLVIDCAHADVILGIGWLRLHDPGRSWIGM